MVLRGIFGPKRDEVTGEWRKLRTEKLHDLYPSTNIIRVIISRRMRWADMQHVWGKKRGVYRVFLVRKTEGNRSFGRSRCTWEDNIKIDLQKVGCGGIDWTELAQDIDRWWALGNTLINLRVP